MPKNSTPVQLQVIGPKGQVGFQDLDTSKLLWIRFNPTGKDAGVYFDVSCHIGSNGEPVLNIRGERPLSIEPNGANVVDITSLKRDTTKQDIARMLELDGLIEKHRCNDMYCNNPGSGVFCKELTQYKAELSGVKASLARIAGVQNGQ